MIGSRPLSSYTASLRLCSYILHSRSKDHLIGGDISPGDSHSVDETKKTREIENNVGDKWILGNKNTSS